MSQEVTPAMLDYQQCALSTSVAFIVEHTTCATAKGVVLVKGKMVSSLSLCFALSHSRLCCIHSVSGGGSGRVGSWAREALH